MMIRPIIIIMIVGLMWFEIIPVRLWIAKVKTKYYGKRARLKIRIIKIIEPIINFLDDL